MSYAMLNISESDEFYAMKANEREIKKAHE